LHSLKYIKHEYINGGQKSFFFGVFIGAHDNLLLLIGSVFGNRFATYTLLLVFGLLFAAAAKINQ
jgi:hypothetical protein